jgi:hypothetical protein
VVTTNGFLDVVTDLCSFAPALGQEVYKGTLLEHVVKAGLAGFDSLAAQIEHGGGVAAASAGAYRIARTV